MFANKYLVLSICHVFYEVCQPYQVHGPCVPAAFRLSTHSDISMPKMCTPMQRGDFTYKRLCAHQVKAERHHNDTESVEDLQKKSVHHIRTEHHEEEHIVQK